MRGTESIQLHAHHTSTAVAHVIGPAPPCRFGKTISVSMFAAAMLYSAPNLELSIYSTCKRISQKLLRNVYKFLDMIYLELGVQRMKELRLNFEEIELQGGEGRLDVRRVNSYPSKVSARVFWVDMLYFFNRSQGVLGWVRLVPVLDVHSLHAAQVREPLRLVEAPLQHGLAVLLQGRHRLRLPQGLAVDALLLADLTHEPVEGHLWDAVASLGLLAARVGLVIVCFCDGFPFHTCS